MGAFVLDSSLLGGEGFVYHEEPIEERGRSIQVTWEQTGVNQDMQLLGYSIRFYPAEFEAKD